jgi:hypothetical protein
MGLLGVGEKQILRLRLRDEAAEPSLRMTISMV